MPRRDQAMRIESPQISWYDAGMKMFPLILMLALAVSPLAAQPTAASLQKEAVAAFQAGNYAAAQSLFESVLSQEPRNLVAKNYLATIAKKTKGAVGLEKSLGAVVIPKVDFRDASAREAVEFVSQRVKSLTEGRQAVNVVWMAPPESNPHVTLSLQNVPASEVLKYIAAAANLELEYDAYAVKVKPAAAPTAVNQ
jgi:hypothetical protein